MEIQSKLTRKKLHRMSQDNFLRETLSNRDNVRSPIKFTKVSQPSILKDDFFLRTDPSVFTSVTLVLLNWSN